MQAFQKIRSNYALIAILLIAVALRVFRLSFQSLWLDELHLMIESDPSISWREMIGWLTCCDIQPPLYHSIQRIVFSIFGYNEFVARMTSVIIGELSVLAMYLLGKEVLNKRLGLICAALTAVNYFDLYYSQEARPYILSFLLTAVSFMFLIRLIRSTTMSNALKYAGCTLLLLYTHYFALYIVCSQIALGLFFLTQAAPEKRTPYLKVFATVALVLTLGYAPWLPAFFKITHSQQAWIPAVSDDFMSALFLEYFGNSNLLKPALLFLFLFFCLKAMERFSNLRVVPIKDEPLQLCFVVLLFWIMIGNLLPFIQSLVLTPVVYPRYMIVLAPAYILMISFAIELMAQPVLKRMVLGCFLILSLSHLFLVKRYYSAVFKTQFREMTAFVVKNNPRHYPIINHLTAWHHQYYLKKFGSKAQVLTGTIESNVDSILRKSSRRYDLPAFWIVGAHGDPKPDTIVREKIAGHYRLQVERDFFDAWAQFYVAETGVD